QGHAGTSPSITTVAGLASKYIVTSNSSTPFAGTVVTITAQLADANNNPVGLTGRLVTWSSAGGGSFASGTSSTSASGVATVTFTCSSLAGTVQTVTATDGQALTGVSGTITSTVGPGAKYLVNAS